MGSSKGNTNCTRGRGIGLFVTLSGLLASSLLLFACEQLVSYEVRSWLFDGVPPPEGTVETGLPGDPTGPDSAEGTRRRAPTGPVSQHKPWVEQKCRACHNVSARPGDAGRFMTRASGAALCLSCHRGFPEDRVFVHGPVAAGACIFCHVPHYSEHKALLISEPSHICERCHDRSGLAQTVAHREAEQARASCTECHDPHGGGDRFFLRGKAR